MRRRYEAVAEDHPAWRSGLGTPYENGRVSSAKLTKEFSLATENVCLASCGRKPLHKKAW